MIHRSERNTSDKSRFIYTYHMIEGDAKWAETNWLVAGSLLYDTRCRADRDLQATTDREDAVHSTLSLSVHFPTLSSTMCGDG